MDVFSYWTVISLVAILTCPLSWMCYMLFYDWVSAHLIPSLTDLRGMGPMLLSSAVFWFVAALIPIVCLLRDFIWKLYDALATTDMTY